MGFSETEIDPYLEELILSKILVHDLEPNLTGENFLDRIISILTRVQNESHSGFTGAILFTLSQLADSLASAKEPDTAVLASVLAQVAEIPVQSKKSLHIDRFQSWGQSTL